LKSCRRRISRLSPPSSAGFPAFRRRIPERAFAALTSAHASSDSYLVAIADDVTLDRSSIAALDGGRSVWVQRNYREQIILGNDAVTGAPMYQHQSVKIQYVVDCASGKLNMAAWSMFSQPDAKGEQVWAGRLQGAEAHYRYAPGTEEEKAVVGALCGASVAALR
jgi:hypothetical protein